MTSSSSCCWFPFLAPLRRLLRRNQLVEHNILVYTPSCGYKEHHALHLIFPQDDLTCVLDSLYLNCNITQVALFGSFVSRLSTTQVRQLLTVIGRLPALVSLQLVNFDHDTPLDVLDLHCALSRLNVQQNLRELALTGGVHLRDNDDNNEEGNLNHCSKKEVSLENQLSKLRALKSLTLAHVTLASDEDEHDEHDTNHNDKKLPSRLDHLLGRLPQLIPSLETLSIRLRHRFVHPLSEEHIHNPNTNRRNGAETSAEATAPLSASTLQRLLDVPNENVSSLQDGTLVSSSSSSSSSCLTTLKLFQVQLDNDRLCSIAQSLRANQQLKELLLQGRRRGGTESNFSSYELNAKACSALVKMIHDNKCLARFHLRGIQIPDARAMALARALEHNMALTFLRLDYPTAACPNNNTHYHNDHHHNSMAHLQRHQLHHQALVCAREYRLIMNYYLKLNRSGVRRFVHDLYYTCDDYSPEDSITTISLDQQYYKHRRTRERHKKMHGRIMEDWIQCMVGKDLDCIYYVLANVPSMITATPLQHII